MVRLNKIYTRTGDDGTTGLVDGSRVAKEAARIAAIGDVDEVNSLIGLAISATGMDAHSDALIRIQNDLFDLGADLATPGEDFEPSDMVLRVIADQVAWLEAAIDTLNETLEPLTSFVLPSGSEAAARIHVARAATRRAERSVARLAGAEPVNPQALAYINRLSDYLFVLARTANAAAAGDVLWIPGKNR